MGKYDRDIQDVYAVKQLGDAIGYGHLMAIAHELWARHLEDRGLPRRGAHCVVGYQMVREQYQAEALNDRIYTIVVDKALEADRKTEPLDKDINVRSKSEPQTLDDIGKQIQDAYDKGLLSDADATQAWYEAVKDEPQTEECPFDDAIPCEWVCTEYGKCKYKPKTEPQNDLLVTEYPKDGEVNLIGRDKTEAVVMAYDVYKELTEPQTEDKCKGCIYENGDSLMACVSCQGKVPYDGYDFMDEPQKMCDADCNEDCTECARESELWKAEQTEPRTERESEQ